MKWDLSLIAPKELYAGVREVIPRQETPLRSYMQAVCALLCILAVLTAEETIRRICLLPQATVDGRALSGIIRVLVTFVMHAGCLGAGAYVFQSILRRRREFLKDMHMLLAVTGPLAFAGHWILSGLWIALAALAATCIAYSLVTLYLLRSKQFAAYMGDDEWRSLTPFSALWGNGEEKKPAPSAVPARGVRGENNGRVVRKRNPYSELYCCICGGKLDEGHAVLFADENGREARIDEKCCAALSALTRSEDEKEIREAMAYMERQKPFVHPIVGRRLERFTDCAKEYLGEK